MIWFRLWMLCVKTHFNILGHKNLLSIKKGPGKQLHRFVNLRIQTVKLVLLENPFTTWSFSFIYSEM